MKAIDQNEQLILCTAAGFANASIGGFGAYVVSRIFSSISPLGVGLACGVTTGLALKILFSNSATGKKFICFMGTYPLGLIVANVLVGRVYFLDPLISAITGYVVLIPMISGSMLCAVVFSGKG